MDITKSRHWYRIKALIPRSVYIISLKLRSRIYSMSYRGSDLYCPVCNKSHKRFRSDACPNCGAYARHRILWLYLKKTGFFSDNLTVLHFSPEFCFYNRFKSLKNLLYYTADPYSPLASDRMFMEDIKYPDRHFDIILSSHVLEHADDDRLALRELYRVQKKGGWSIHIVPVYSSLKATFEDPSAKTPQDRKRLYGCYAHKRKYGRDYKERLQAPGFKVDILKTCDFCSAEDMAKMHLPADFELYICRK